MKHTLLKKKDTAEFKKVANKTFLQLTAISILSLCFAGIGKLTGWINYDWFIGAQYLVYCVIAVLCVYIINKDYIFNTNSLHNKMTSTRFIKNFCTMITLMTAFTIPTVLLNMCLMPFGYSLIQTAAANETSSNLADFLYASLFGPICEEVLFRGFLQNRFMKYSPPLAIFISAIAFGVYHGSFSQMFAMIGVGIALGYIAYTYSLKWSITIHIIYNFIFGEVFGRLSDLLEKDGEEFVIPIIDKTPFMATIMLLSILGIVFIGKKILTNKLPFRDYNFKTEKMVVVFKTAGMLLFCAINITIACFLIEKI